MQYQFKTNPIQNHFKGKYQIIINAIPNYDKCNTNLKQIQYKIISKVNAKL